MIDEIYEFMLILPYLVKVCLVHEKKTTVLAYATWNTKSTHYAQWPITEWY